MAYTNFSKLHENQKAVWSRDVWKIARNNSFIAKFSGSGMNSMVTRVSELTESERGTKAVLHLVADLVGDGVIGDNTLENNEEEIASYDTDIQIDQMRHATRHKGRLEHQKTVINFREQARDVLGYWLADRTDQLGFLSLAGIPYSLNTDGSIRANSPFPDLAFAPENVSGTPTSNRYFVWDGSALAATTMTAGATGHLYGSGHLVSGARISYQALVRMRQKARELYLRGIKGEGGQELYHVFVTPAGMADLKLDPDFLANVRNALPRASSNPLFAGYSSIMIDGMVIHEYRHVPNTAGAGASAKWGASDDVDGFACLFCGAQALGMVDIGVPTWVEKEFDYDNQPGISVSKICGFLNPKFKNARESVAQNFGMMRVDFASEG